MIHEDEDFGFGSFLMLCAGLLFFGTALYVVVHFVVKYW